ARDARRGGRVRGGRALTQSRGRARADALRRSLGAAALQRPTAGEARVGLMPEPDLVLVEQPAEIDLLAVANRREVDQAALDVAQHDVDGLELPERQAEQHQRTRNVPPRERAADGRVELREGLARLRTVRDQDRARVLDAADSLGDPAADGARLLDRVVP